VAAPIAVAFATPAGETSDSVRRSGAMRPYRAPRSRRATELMATMSYNTAILGGRIGEGAAISTAMIPFLLGAIMISWFGLQKRKWQQGSDND